MRDTLEPSTPTSTPPRASLEGQESEIPTPYETPPATPPTPFETPPLAPTPLTLDDFGESRVELEDEEKRKTPAAAESTKVVVTPEAQEPASALLNLPPPPPFDLAVENLTIGVPYHRTAWITGYAHLSLV